MTRVIEIAEDDLLVFIVLADVRELLFGIERQAQQSFADLVFAAALSSRSVLRIGVALLGARITFEQIAGLGRQTTHRSSELVA
jgi:uncharacterized membrane protein YadS